MLIIIRVEIFTLSCLAYVHSRVYFELFSNKWTLIYIDTFMSSVHGGLFFCIYDMQHGRECLNLENPGKRQMKKFGSALNFFLLFLTSL